MAVGVETVSDPLPAGYRQACYLAVEGRYDDALRLYGEVESAALDADVRLRALIKNDLAALAALEGRLEEAHQGWQQAMEVDPSCRLAGLNDVLIVAEMERLTLRQGNLPAALEPAPVPAPSTPSAPDTFRVTSKSARQGRHPQLPLQLALDRRRQHPHGRAGRVLDPGRLRGAALLRPLSGLGHRPRPRMSCSARARRSNSMIRRWNVARDSGAIPPCGREFQPDYVVITDAWNMKPLLAEAVRGYPVSLAVPGPGKPLPAQ